MEGGRGWKLNFITLDLVNSNPNVANSFPREDEGSPRQAILDKFCQDDVKQFRNCMNANNYDENKCLPTKMILDKCAANSFKKVNAEPEWIF